MIKWNDNKKNLENSNNYKERESNICKDKIKDGKKSKTMIEKSKADKKKIF